MKSRSMIAMIAVLLVLAAGYYFRPRRVSAPAEQIEPVLWSVEMEKIERIRITLAAEALSGSWVVHEDQFWYFDRPGGPRVDVNRWGGGVPLLLSGPRASRVIVRDATDDELLNYGLVSPFIEVVVTLAGGPSIRASIGDRTPGGGGYYVSLHDSRDIFTVDYTWVHVLEQLVRDPPYPD